MHKANAKIIELMASSTPLNTPTQKYIGAMARRNNRLQARNPILEQRVEAATVVLNGRKERSTGKWCSIKGKNIITGVELDSIREAELATQQWKRKRSNMEPAVSNIMGDLSSNAAATMDSTPLPDFVEGGFIISFEDSVN